MSHPARRDRGSSLSTFVVLTVAFAGAGLGFFADGIVEEARELFAEPTALVAPIVSTAPMASSPAEPVAFPRQAAGLRAELSAPAAPSRTAELIGRLSLLGDASDVRRIEPFLDSRSALVRHAALQGLARLGGEPAVERVAARARAASSDPDVYAAIHALAASDTPLAEDVLVDLVRSGEQWRKDAALGALAGRGGATARQLLHGELLSGPVTQSWYAAQNVARLGGPEDARLLMRLAAGSGQRADSALHALTSLPSEQVDGFLVELAQTATGPRKGQALTALGQVRAPEAVDVLEDALLGSARWHGEALTALGQSKVGGALEVLLNYLPEARPSVSYQVCAALAARPEDEARTALRSLARGEDALAEAALGALTTADDGAVAELLIERFEVSGKLPPAQTLTWLATRGGDDGWDLIEEVLAGGNQSDRSSVVWALQMRGDEDARDRLIDLARSGDTTLAPTALGALEQMDEEARDALRGILVERIESGEANDWGQSMSTLARLGGDEARELLVTRMESGTLQERSQALSALGQMDDPEARSAMARVYRETDDASLRSQALNALLWSPDGLDPELMDEALASDDPAVVAQVIGALPHAGDGDVTERLMGFVDSDDVGVRSAALGALAQSGGEDAERALVAALDDPEVGSQAVWNLQSLGTPGAREALRDAAASGDVGVRSTAIGALGADPSDAATEILHAGLQDGDEQVVIAAIGALQGRGNTAAAEAIAELLVSVADDGASSVGQQAAWALQAIGGSVAVEHADLIAEMQGGEGDAFGWGLGWGGEEMPIEGLIID